MYLISPEQDPYILKDSYEWGKFFVYIEIGKDKFSTRSVREYENGFITRYDRQHWEDQFGSLPDFRFGEKWVEHWGEPKYIAREVFEKIWGLAALSEPYKRRNDSPEIPCIWIEFYDSDKWAGQP